MDETSQSKTPAAPAPASSPLEARRDQRLSVAILAGLAAAIIGGILWAVITVTTKYQIGFMAIGVGFLVGYAVSLGHAVDKIFGIIGATFALLGCLLGNCLSLIGFAANEENSSLSAVLGSLDFSTLFSAMTATMQPMDFLFYGIAIYEGYRFSFRRVAKPA